jgi:hypothetical protein
MKKAIAIIVVAGSALALTACESAPSANQQEQAQQADIQSTLIKNQPIPFFPLSEYRETLIQVETAEAHGVATTSFFFNQGVREPIFSCPSIGFPIPTTAQLTNPKQVIYNGGNGGGGNVTVDQMDPNGVYTGESTGTYVECVDPTGVKYAQYWEGFVNTVGAPAHWDGKAVALDGPPTVVTPKK